MRQARQAAANELAALREEKQDLLSKVDAMSMASTDAQVLAEKRRLVSGAE